MIDQGRGAIVNISSRASDMVQTSFVAYAAGKAALDVKIVQLVRLLRNGEPVKMSKRAGEFVTLDELQQRLQVGRQGKRRECGHRGSADADQMNALHATPPPLRR